MMTRSLCSFWFSQPMIQKTGLTDRLRCCFLRCIVAIAGLDIALGNALAEEDEIIEEVIVTGTRIARDPNLAGALPVQTVTAEDIQLSGDFDLSDILNDLPALSTSRTTQDSSGEQGDTSVSANVLSLRGLGNVRTLVLVNGRRHVGGVSGTASVDVSSIPIKLVERVEVLTGGASAIYGADAVTGVVNFIMKDDYEGFGVDIGTGISDKGDSQELRITATWGANFADERGNIAMSVDYRVGEGLRAGDRPGKLYATADRRPNPDLRFQIGDIVTGLTPNFAQFYNFANTGLTDFGLPIPSATDFIAAYNSAFGTDPLLTDAELSLFDRAANAFPLAVLPQATTPFTSAYGTIIPGNPFTFAGFDPLTPIDLNNNGNPDCLDSFTGYNSVFGAASFGLVGGCWTIGEDGSYAPVRDALIGGTFGGFGGDSFESFYDDRSTILPPDDKLTLNLFGHFDFNDRVSVFGEFKYATRTIELAGRPNSFWDLMFGAVDNPFVPSFLRPVTQQTGGVAVTIDPLLFDSVAILEEDTYRAVLGIEGTFSNDWSYEISANVGRYERLNRGINDVIVDRWFAATDAVVDPATGQPACRADVDQAAAPMNTPFLLPPYDSGYFSFTPGTGQCIPLNIWAGRPGATQMAKDWVTRDSWRKVLIDQVVISASITGDTTDFFELPGGAVSFALGAEFRDESSEQIWDAWRRGVIPEGATFPAGTNISDWSDNTSLLFQPQVAFRNEKGSFNVVDVFIEASAPLLTDRRGARELTIEAAVRYSNYSTIGSTTTWKTNLIYSPINSLTFRGGYSEAVRAPNIGELFGPETGALFNVNDPCDAAILDAIAVSDPALAQQTQDNCVSVFETIGLDPFDAVTGTYNFVNPLNARVIGVASGNRQLSEETAETITAGFVFEPDFVEGFSITVDYWDISIDGAIESVNAQNIVDGCYRGASLNPVFCQMSDRNSDPLSIFYGGFNFIRSTVINFAKIETSGYDIAVIYGFDAGAHGFDVTVQATKVKNINFFGNPLDLADANPELGEIKRPEIVGNIFLNWTWRDLFVRWQAQYWGEQLLENIEVEEAQSLFGPSVTMGAVWQHNLSMRYLLNDSLMIYGGVKNVTDEQPFITSFAFPVSARGRFLFAGIEYQL
jgi:iron complex outermembrane recepter protein